MKRLITLLSLILFLAAGFQAGAQSMSNYAFSTNTGASLIDISSGSTTAIFSGNDDTPSGLFDIGFNVVFMGGIYTQFSVSPDGFLKFGSPAAVSQFTNSLTSTTNVPKIAPYWDDLATGTDGYVRFKTIGTAPNRQLVIEWRVTVPRNTSGPATATYQAVVNESSGVIEFIYGAIPTGTSSYSVGLTSSAIQFASVTTSANTVSYAATNDIQTDAIASGRQYIFTPPSAPIAPTNMQFTAVSQTSMTVNWTDNSSNETGFQIYRSTDGINYTLITTVAAGAVTYTSTGLLPGITYYWNVYAINEGAISTALSGNQATSSPGSIVSQGNGNWSSTTPNAPWPGGIIPTAGDNVTIADGTTVTLDVAGICNALTVGGGTSGVLALKAFTLTANSHVTVAAGGTINMDAAGGTAGNLSVGGDLTNNGTIDLYASGSIYGKITFTGTSNATFTLNTGSVSDFDSGTSRGVIVNKGTSATPVLEFIYNGGTVSVQGVTSPINGFFGITNGTLKFGGSVTFSYPMFNVVGYSIPATGGIWLNNTNFTVAGQGGSPTNNGAFRVTAGTYNIGTSAGNSLGSGSNSTYLIEGGAVNAAGRFNLTSTGVYYKQTGGTVTVTTVGNTASSSAGFGVTSSTGTTFEMSGGSIVVQLASTGATPYDYYVNAATRIITGGTLQLGNASSGTAKTFNILGFTPNVELTSTSAIHGLTLRGSTTVLGDLTLNSTGTFTNNFNSLTMAGMNSTYPGNININGATFTINTSSTQTLSFTSTSGNQSIVNTGGTITGSQLPSVTLNNTFGGAGTVTIPGGLTMIGGATLTLTKGTLNVGSGITLGTGGTTGFTFIKGDGAISGTTTFGYGTGAVNYTYNGSSAQVTGTELPASINGLTINNANGVTLNSPLGATGFLTLTTGILTTSNTNLLTIGTPTTLGTMSTGSATAFINGPVAKYFPASRTASGTYSTSTLYPLGKGTTYLPMYVDPTTNAGGAVIIRGEAFTSNSGTMGAGVTFLSANRWEALITSGGANFSSSFLRIGDAAIVSGNQILQAASAAGSYGAIPASSTFASGTPNTLTTGAQIPSAFYNGYFAYGDLTACSAPTAQPTNLVTSFVSSTGFTGSFTAAVPAPSHYLVVRYANLSTPTNPVDYTNYTVGATLGTGTVRMSGTATTFVETGLTANTTYDYYIYSYNNSGCYGPVYLTTSPLFSSIATCAVAVGVPGTPTSANVTDVSFTANWTASSTLNATYFLDVATDAGFTSFLPGYSMKNMGTNLTENITGLTQNTPYYVRVRAFDGSTSCYSSYSGTLTQTTQLIVAPPWEEGFLTTSTPAGWSITGWTIGTTSGVTGNPGNTIFKNFYSLATTGTFTTCNIGPLPANSALSFDYLLANWSSPYGPPAAGSGNYVVSITTDFGANYTDLETVVNNGTAGWQAKQYDLTSYAGSTIMIKIVGTWTSGDYNLAFDNFKVFQQLTMSYVSSTTTQTNTGAVAIGATDAQIIGIEIVTVNSLSPISVTSFSMNTNGTTAPSDIAAANLYYTGTSGGFATTTAFGSPVNTPSGVFAFNGSQQLQTGTNYFWLAYDIAPGATSGNQVDAECTQITVASQNYAPTVTAPAGSRTINAPLAGTKTVGTGGDFATLTGNGGLFETVSLLGLSGNLTATITTSITTEPGTHALNAWPETGTGGYTLTIKPASGATPTVSGSLDNDALIRIIGASRTIIDGSNNGTDSRDLTISNTSITSPFIMLLGSVGTTPLADVTVKNSTLINGVNTATAIIISDETSGDPGYFDNILIENNEIQQAFGGLFIVAATGEGTNLSIIGNLLNATGSSSIRWYGMYLEGVDNGVISGNEIGNFDASSSEDDAGISLGSGCTSIDIFNNRIDNLGYTGTGGYGAHGIEVITGMTSADINIYNNLISNLTGDGYSYTSSLFATDNPIGILLGSTQSGINVLNNSIYLTGNTLNQSSAMSAGIFVGTGTSASINNNIIVNNLGLSGALGYGSCGVYAQTANTQFTSINNNDYVVSPTGTGAKAIGKISTTTTALTLAEWQTATTQDAASISADPLFTDNLLRLSAPYSPAIGKAAPLAKVTDDYSGNARHPLYPTIGAHEYAPVNGWIGNTTNWNLGTNWSFGTVPDDTYWVIIPTNPSGGSDPSIPSPVEAECNGLTIENNASIDIQNGAKLNVKNQ